MPEHHTFRFLPDGEPIPGGTYRADGWAYVDFPRMLHADWDQLLAVIGEGRWVALTLAKYRNGTSRGQLLISPQGVENLAAHYRPKMH